MEAYLAGLEQARDNGHDLSKIHSVASFFVSRVDTEIDKRLDRDRRHDDLLGQGRRRQRRLAYRAYEEFFAATAGRRSAAAGAHTQRPLWASTGVKNPDYRDTMYVDDLVVANTVNTMPEKTLDAVADHGEIAGDQVTSHYDDAEQVMDRSKAAGIDYDDVIAVLEREGVEKFEASWNELLDTGRRASWTRPRLPRDGAPVDPTTTDAWGALTAHRRRLRPDLRAWFADDPGRVERLTFTAADLHVDLSKNLLDDDVLAALLALADEVGPDGRRDAMFRGEHINVTEDRASAAHRAAPPADAVARGRRPGRRRRRARGAGAGLRLRRAGPLGAWTGVTGERIRDGRQHRHRRLRPGPGDGLRGAEPYVQDGLECRFISNIDPTDRARRS